MPPHCQARQSIPAVRCELPYDPPVGVMQRKDDITPGRAALRDFKPAYVGSGSTPEVAVWALMSALADSGRATGSAWVRVSAQQRPRAGAACVSGSQPSLDHFIGAGEQLVRHGEIER